MAAKKGNPGYNARRKLSPLQRFRSYCEFDPATGCVIWTGAQTQGRGHNVPYGSFWFEGRRWFAHRWAAKFIHGLGVEEMQIDHCCSEYGLGVDAPNTLCVQHLQAVTPKLNRELQVRRFFVHLQVGLLNYEEEYQIPPTLTDPTGIPFLSPPAWLTEGKSHDPDTAGNSGCPF